MKVGMPRWRHDSHRLHLVRITRMFVLRLARDVAERESRDVPFIVTHSFINGLWDPFPNLLT